MRKPIIGITSNLDSMQTAITNSDEFVFVRSNYISAIAENGGIPLIITSKMGIADAAHLIEGLDGLLLIGGQDVDPSFYGEERLINYVQMAGFGTPYNRPLSDRPNPERDAFEIALYQAAKARKLPIIGICRGYQLINVAEGGSLFQELEIHDVMHTMEVHEVVPDHEIFIHKGSHAYQIFGSTCFLTCSIHHQGVKSLGKNLIATGFAKDGLIEVVEATDPEHFLIGVQGHPERSCKKIHEHSLLFSAFIKACNNLRHKIILPIQDVAMPA